MPNCEISVRIGNEVRTLNPEELQQGWIALSSKGPSLLHLPSLWGENILGEDILLVRDPRLGFTVPLPTEPTATSGKYLRTHYETQTPLSGETVVIDHSLKE